MSIVEHPDWFFSVNVEHLVDLDDEERLAEELKDLIDDRPIEEDGSDGEDSDASGRSRKRKKSDDDGKYKKGRFSSQSEQK